MVENPGTNQAGLLLYAGNSTYGGLSVKAGKIRIHWRGSEYPVGDAGERVWLKVRNITHDASYFFSADGQHWTKCERGTEFSSARVRLALFATGKGVVNFQTFGYLGLE